MREYIAHVRESDTCKQLLTDHLHGTAERAARFAGEAGLRRLGELAGLLHDIGKSTDEFYYYLLSACGLLLPEDENYLPYKKLKGKIDHAGAGAALLHKNAAPDNLIAKSLYQLLELVCASHHTGLIDCLNPEGDNRLLGRIEKGETFEQAIGNLDPVILAEIRQALGTPGLLSEFSGKINNLMQREYAKNIKLQIGFIVKFILSCLIDADRLDTADFEDPMKGEKRNDDAYVTWAELSLRLERALSEFKSRNDVDRMRRKVSEECLKAASRPRGLFILTVPTGGGKTLSSLRFAINHADMQKKKLKRIIYVVPFTTIIDQNVQTARKILETEKDRGKVILEHHANLSPEERTEQNELLSENWDAPIVFTTMVQFLDSFFAGGTSHMRRLHRMANAVVIFDEVQALPVKCVDLFIAAVKCLVNSLDSTVVLCTATQPLFNEVTPASRALAIAPEQHIISDEAELFRAFKRCEVKNICKSGGYSFEEVAERIKAELDQTGSVLAIVNTKDSAKKLSEALGEVNGADVFYLSTNMCSAHRMDVIDKIRKNLNPESFKRTVCISTQLIEAGVDIDFGSVIRYLAGLDSIAQAAGRCNRHGLRQSGNVLIVNPQYESLNKLVDIREGAQSTQRLLKEYEQTPDDFKNDPTGPKSISQYFRYYFCARNAQMGYIMNEKTGLEMFELLSENDGAIKEYRRIHGKYPPMPLCQSFQTAAQHFTAIDSDTRGVIVYYKDSADIISGLCAERNPNPLRELMKDAQRYSVNLYSYELEALSKEKAIHRVQEDIDIYYLDKQYYNEKYGISKGKMENLFY